MNGGECITHTSKKQPPTGGGGSRRGDVLDVVIYNLPSKKNNIQKAALPRIKLLYTLWYLFCPIGFYVYATMSLPRANKR